MEMTNTYARLMQVSPGEVVEVSEDFVSRGEKNYEGIQVKIYTVQSEAATNPHIVYLDNSSKVVFIQLSLRESDRQFYTEELKSRGEVGQVFLPKVKSELMYGYPDAGIAYIANGYAGEVIRIQKFLPKDHLEFQNQEGSNFVPITVLSPTPRKIAEGNELFSESNYSMLVYAAIGLSIIVVTLIIWLGFSLRKNR